MARLKILHFGKFAKPFFGGIEYCVGVIEDLIEEEGYRSTLLEFTKTTDKSLALSRQAGKRNQFRTTFSISSQPISLRYIVSSIRHLRNDADLIIVHLPNPIAALLILIFKREAKLILFWHSDIVNKNRILAGLADVISNFLCMRAHSVVSTSQQYIEHSSILKLHKNKTSVIPIGKEFYNDEFEVSRIDCNGYFVSIGRLVNYKNYIKAIREYKQNHCQFSWYIIGSGPLESELRQEILRLKLDNVHLLGRVETSDLREILRNATGHLLPSNTRDEAYGVVNIEAMHLGIPSVVFGIEGSGVSSIIQNGINGFVAKNNDFIEFFSFANQIFELGEPLRNSTRKCWEEHFTVEKMKSRWINLIHSVFEDPYV